MDALLTQANDLIGKVWPVVVAVVGAGLAIRIFKILFKSGLNFTQGTRCPFIKKRVTMRRKILILSAVLISPFSHAESWESITKSTYQSSAYAESKQITNQDGSKITVYYIDAAMQASACQVLNPVLRVYLLGLNQLMRVSGLILNSVLFLLAIVLTAIHQGRRINIGL